MTDVSISGVELMVLVDVSLALARLEGVGWLAGTKGGNEDEDES
jgi:hypothetical protein